MPNTHGVLKNIVIKILASNIKYLKKMQSLVVYNLLLDSKLSAVIKRMFKCLTATQTGMS